MVSFSPFVKKTRLAAQSLFALKPTYGSYIRAAKCEINLGVLKCSGDSI